MIVLRCPYVPQRGLKNAKRPDLRKKIANVSRSGNLMSQPCNSKDIILSNGHFCHRLCACHWNKTSIAMSVFIGKYWFRTALSVSRWSVYIESIDQSSWASLARVPYHSSPRQLTATQYPCSMLLMLFVDGYMRISLRWKKNTSYWIVFHR